MDCDDKMMPYFTKAVGLSSLMGFGFGSYAGTMGDTNSSDFSGFYLGAGGSYIYTSVSGTTYVNMSTSPGTSQYPLVSTLTNHLAPLVDAGYSYNLPNNWLIGVKGLYKYIGSEQLALSWSGTFPVTNTYQTAGLYTKLVQDFALLLDGGYHFGNWLLYAGVGPGAATAEFRLNGDVLPATSTSYIPVNRRTETTLWGGAGQIGVQYLLPNRFTVDLSYNFTATASASLNSILFPSYTNAAYSAFNQRVQITEQGFNITLNKYF